MASWLSKLISKKPSIGWNRVLFTVSSAGLNFPKTGSISSCLVSPPLTSLFLLMVKDLRVLFPFKRHTPRQPPITILIHTLHGIPGCPHRNRKISRKLDWHKSIQRRSDFLAPFLHRRLASLRKSYKEKLPHH